jgi:glycerophosphoryl diester phosphodiesterase
MQKLSTDLHNLYLNNKQKETHYFLDLPIRLYGTGQSLKTWQRNRLALSFEPKSSAKARAEKSKEDGIVAKDHVGNLDRMDWDKNQLLAEVKTYEDGHNINWTNLATRYNVTNKDGKLAKNGGQIVKEWLTSNGVDLTRFEIQEKKGKDGGTIARRKKRRITGGEISFPTEVQPKVLKEMLQEKLQKGIYTIGDRIVPKKVR